MATEAEEWALYQAYLRGEDPPQPKTMAGRVEETISNKAKARTPVKDVEYEPSQTVENFPESLAQAGSDMAQMFMNPIDTVSNLGSLVKGGIDKGSRALANALPDSALTAFTPETGVYRSPEPWGNEPMADAAAQGLDDRYGSLNAFKTTAMEDPAGMALDFLGGSALVPGKVGRMAAKIDPIDLPFKTAGAVLDPAKMYNQVAKFYKGADTDALTKTALSERIMPTQSGLDKTSALIGETGDEISNVINDSLAKGELIDSNQIKRHVNALRENKGRFRLSGIKDVQKVDDVIKEFNDMVETRGFQNVPADEVQAFKRDIYDTVDWGKKQSKGNRTAVEARKAFARGAKEELEKIIPEIKDLNIKQGDLIELADELEGPAYRIDRRDPWGLAATAKTGVGNLIGQTAGSILGEPAIGGAIGTGLGGFLAVLGSPTIKARLAIELNAIKNSPMSNAQARVAALELLRNVAASENEQSINYQQASQ